MFPLLYEACELFCSSVTTLKEEREVGPGCVEIIPRKRVTPHVRTWLYSEQTERKMVGREMYIGIDGERIPNLIRHYRLVDFLTTNLQNYIDVDFFLYQLIII